MIPYSLQFSGIRDYKPVKLTFGEDGEHILISGPNGAGKSTITFAIGAVLYSAKVDIEGLRSANLRSGQTWNAEVFLTFHNTGVSKIDGAPFIAFQLLIKQEPNEVIQRQFKIYTGDSPDDLKQIATEITPNPFKLKITFDSMFVRLCWLFVGCFLGLLLTV